jgi:hypothetical protein
MTEREQLVVASQATLSFLSSIESISVTSTAKYGFYLCKEAFLCYYYNSSIPVFH